MNIWYIHPFAGGPGIGRGYRPYYLGKEWLRLGHDVVVITAAFHHHLDKDAQLSSDQTVDGIRYVSLPVRRYAGNGVGRVLNMLDFAFGVGRLGRRVPADLTSPDAIIVSSPHPFALMHAWRLARRFKAKFIFEVRDLWPLSIREMLGAPALHPLVLICGRLERFAYRHADVVVSLLAGVDRYIHDIGMRPRQFFWAPNGVDPTTRGVEPTTPAGRGAADTIAVWRSEGRTVMIYAGTIGAPNGLDVLVESIAAANSAGGTDSLGVLIVGQGASWEHISSMVMARGLPNVAMFPAVPKGEAVWLIEQADIGYGGLKAHDAVFQFGTSQNKVMDYMQAGLPVVFPVRAFRDPVSESGGGVAVPDPSPRTVADAILHLVEAGPDGRREMGERGRDYVKAHFGWSAIAAGYADVLKTGERS